MGYVYFITDEKKSGIKIGYTKNNVYKRLKQLQTGNSNKLILLYYIKGSMDKEKSLHNYFSNDYNILNEWYDYDMVFNWIKRDKITTELQIKLGIIEV